MSLVKSFALCIFLRKLFCEYVYMYFVSEVLLSFVHNHDIVCGVVQVYRWLITLEQVTSVDNSLAPVL